MGSDTSRSKSFVEWQAIMLVTTSSKTNDQWVFLLKKNKLHFINWVIFTALFKD
jgi:hypothetical protein